MVPDYLSGGGSGRSVAVKYGIHAERTVLKWVKQYNSHVELTDPRKTGGYLMTKNIKPRKTTPVPMVMVDKEVLNQQDKDS